MGCTVQRVSMVKIESVALVQRKMVFHYPQIT